MERLFFFVIAVALAFGVGCLVRNRKIGFGWAFGISLINVVISFICIIMRGNPNLGPSVWVAIGVYLLYRKNT